MKIALRIRKKKKTAKPKFKRQEGKKHKKLKTSWRRPKGHTSKLRRGIKARGKKPSSGYRSPLAVRGLNKKGLAEVRVSTAKDLEKLNPKVHMAVLAGGMGKKKKSELSKLANEKKILVANA